MRLHRMATAGLFVAAIFAASGCDGFKSNPNFGQNAAQSANTAQSANVAQSANIAQSASVASAPAATSNTPAGAPAPAATAIGPDQLQPPPGDPDSGSEPAGLAVAHGSAAPEAVAIDAASFSVRPTATAKRHLLIRAQVILDRAHFSPGVIDGRNGTNFRRALSAFEAANGVAPAGAGLATLDTAGWQALVAADSAPVTQDYVITAHDVRGPFLGTVPAAMVDLAKLPHLGYSTSAQGLAAKFHMDEALLRALNPKADFTSAGTSIIVVQPAAASLPPVARVEVDKSNDEVRAYGAKGNIVAVFPATVGSTERPAPTGQWAVRSVVSNPTYTYDPSRLTFGDRSHGKLTIQPGPNNPVGSTWIDLTVATYGIHGTPDPTQIGKSASHGCVRLTNWDVAALGRAIKKGTPVLFVGAQQRKA
jgi:lipoprotein-anchoring transpeptidase ErfK/SrfK